MLNWKKGVRLHDIACGGNLAGMPGVREAQSDQGQSVAEAARKAREQKKTPGETEHGDYERYA